jgi:ribonuclease HI
MLKIYTDGACWPNPGNGGWGVVIYNGEDKQEYSGGFRETTNQRMELKACIEALLNTPKNVNGELYSDSQYVVSPINDGRLELWRKLGWKRGKKASLANADLWVRLYGLYKSHPQIKFVWIRGHSGIRGNEQADQLAETQAGMPQSKIDKGYENKEDAITDILVQNMMSWSDKV